MSNQEVWEEQAVPRREPALESLETNRLAGRPAIHGGQKDERPCVIPPAWADNKKKRHSAVQAPLQY